MYNPYLYPYNPNLVYGPENMYGPWNAFPRFIPPQLYSNYNNFYDDFYYDQRFALPYQLAANLNTIDIKDYGPEPFVININEATLKNTNYRTALWTGKYLQVTLMSINVGEDIGLEIHPDTDQFFRIESGQGIAKMGKSKDKLDFQKMVRDDDAIFIPAGTWHNVVNTGTRPLKLYSIYAPPHHPHGTIHQTKAIAEAEED